MTLNAAALLLAGHDPAHGALACGDERMNYGELVRAVARAASAWRALGVGPGDPVALQVSDGIDGVVAHLGAIWAGGVAVFVNPRMPADESKFAEAAPEIRRLMLTERRQALVTAWIEDLIANAEVEDYRSGQKVEWKPDPELFTYVQPS